ncbi:MAG: fluoride efflux transporter CrcB [Alphaproteobacteria bacterium]|nr:fluoride efflux transporter CrcB [Alphaproteobacteria bacterium]
MNPSVLLAIALGGALGALGRHFVGSLMLHWLGASFPWGTLVVNVVGSFAMGALVETMALVWSPSQELRALLTVGFLGAFTTFSTFSLDFYVVLQRGEIGLASIYLLASVSLAIGGLLAGLAVMRVILT